MTAIARHHTTFAPTFGAIVHDKGTRFRVWAPAQEQVSLVLEGTSDLTMARDAAGFFTADAPGVRAGQRYQFRLREGLRPDPASRFQPEGPLGPSEVIDPRSYQWTDDAWKGAPEPHAHVLYEMHVGTYTPEGTWEAAESLFPEVERLGITTIEVMPIADFSGEFGWGYDGVDLFAPTRLYGTPDDVRHFVDAAHRHGLAVILDVVYNHFGPVGNFMRDFAPAFFGKPGDWGESINYDAADSGPVRQFMRENAAYWIADYHFDGLRFDATHGINDSSPTHIIKEMSRDARAAAGARRIFLVGESEPQDTSLLRDSNGDPLQGDGLDAIWNEDWHHSTYVALTGRRVAYFTDYWGTASELAGMARHGFLYQGQWYSWQTQPRGHYAIGLRSSAMVAFLENHDQVANTGIGRRLFQHVDQGKWRALTALLILGPQLPMLFQGQEFASTRPFTYFADHEPGLADAVHRGRLEFLSQFPGMTTPDMQSHLPRPSDPESFLSSKLNHAERDEHQWALAFHRDLLRLRRDDRVLSRVGTEDVTIAASSPTTALVLVRYMAPDAHRLLVVNLGSDYVSPMNDPLYAPLPGTKWARAWISEAPAYGGTAINPFDDAGPWLIPAAAAALFESREPSASSNPS